MAPGKIILARWNLNLAKYWAAFEVQLIFFRNSYCFRIWVFFSDLNSLVLCLKITSALFISVLVIAQCFGLMPVRGILAATTKGLSFSWINLRTCYCLIYTLLTTASTGLTLNMTIRSVLEVDSICKLIFMVYTMLKILEFPVICMYSM